ncbi:hypothetical protein GC173_00230 [bacterium]|nr:hypothetical protein [bacterium]
MSFWKKLFGGGPSPAPAEPQKPSAPVASASKPSINLDSAGSLLDCSRIDWNEAGQLEFVRERLGNLVGFRLASLLASEGFRGNPWCSPVDAALLFAIHALLEPTRQMEVGSGYTTLVFNHARRVLNLPGELITIDPEPRCDVGEFVDAQLMMRIEEVPVDDFKLLMAGEIAFFDLPHTEVALDHVYTTVLPSLAPGVIVGLHGVRLPRQYDREQLAAGFCEQERLLAFMQEHKPEVIFAGGWLAEHHPGLVAASLEGTDWSGESTALWMRIRPRA